MSLDELASRVEHLRRLWCQCEGQAAGRGADHKIRRGTIALQGSKRRSTFGNELNQNASGAAAALAKAIRGAATNGMTDAKASLRREIEDYQSMIKQKFYDMHDELRLEPPIAAAVDDMSMEEICTVVTSLRAKAARYCSVADHLRDVETRWVALLAAVTEYEDRTKAMSRAGASGSKAAKNSNASHLSTAQVDKLLRVKVHDATSILQEKSAALILAYEALCSQYDWSEDERTAARIPYRDPNTKSVRHVDLYGTLKGCLSTLVRTPGTKRLFHPCQLSNVFLVDEEAVAAAATMATRSRHRKAGDSDAQSSTSMSQSAVLNQTTTSHSSGNRIRRRQNHPATDAHGIQMGFDPVVMQQALKTWSALGRNAFVDRPPTDVPFESRYVPYCVDNALVSSPTHHGDPLANMVPASELSSAGTLMHARPAQRMYAKSAELEERFLADHPELHRHVTPPKDPINKEESYSSIPLVQTISNERGLLDESDDNLVPVRGPEEGVGPNDRRSTLIPPPSTGEHSGEVADGSSSDPSSSLHRSPSDRSPHPDIAIKIPSRKGSAHQLDQHSQHSDSPPTSPRKKSLAGAAMLLKQSASFATTGSLKTVPSRSISMRKEQAAAKENERLRIEAEKKAMEERDQRRRQGLLAIRQRIAARCLNQFASFVLCVIQARKQRELHRHEDALAQEFSIKPVDTSTSSIDRFSHIKESELSRRAKSLVTRFLRGVLKCKTSRYVLAWLKRHRRQDSAARILQGWVRRLLARRKDLQQFDIYWHSLQCARRRQLRAQNAKVTSSIHLVQRVLRGYKCRLDINCVLKVDIARRKQEALRCACWKLVATKELRLRQQRQRATHERSVVLDQFRRASINIQRVFRGFLARRRAARVAHERLVDLDYAVKRSNRVLARAVRRFYAAFLVRKQRRTRAENASDEAMRELQHCAAARIQRVWFWHRAKEVRKTIIEEQKAANRRALALMPKGMLVKMRVKRELRNITDDYIDRLCSKAFQQVEEEDVTSTYSLASRLSSPERDGRRSPNRALLRREVERRTKLTKDDVPPIQPPMSVSAIATSDVSFTLFNNTNGLFALNSDPATKPFTTQAVQALLRVAPFLLYTVAAVCIPPKKPVANARRTSEPPAERSESRLGDQPEASASDEEHDKEGEMSPIPFQDEDCKEHSDGENDTSAASSDDLEEDGGTSSYSDDEPSDHLNSAEEKQSLRFSDRAPYTEWKNANDIFVRAASYGVEWACQMLFPALNDGPETLYLYDDLEEQIGAERFMLTAFGVDTVDEWVNLVLTTPDLFDTMGDIANKQTCEETGVNIEEDVPEEEQEAAKSRDHRIRSTRFVQQLAERAWKTRSLYDAEVIVFCAGVRSMLRSACLKSIMATMQLLVAANVDCEMPPQSVHQDAVQIAVDRVSSLLLHHIPMPPEPIQEHSYGADDEDAEASESSVGGPPSAGGTGTPCSSSRSER